MAIAGKITEAAATRALKRFLEIIYMEIRSAGAGRSEIGGLGVFKRVWKQPKKISAFGKPHTIPGHNAVVFRPSKKLKRMVQTPWP
jgi:nucleoid DNA-binding protein